MCPWSPSSLSSDLHTAAIAGTLHHCGLQSSDIPSSSLGVLQKELHPPPTPAREQQTRADICKLYSECFETAPQVRFGKGLSDLPHSENVLCFSEHFVTHAQEGAFQRWFLCCFRVTLSCPCDSQTLWSWRKSSPRHQKSFHTQAVVQELPRLCWSRAEHGPCNSCGRWRSSQGLLLLLCWELRQAEVEPTRHTHTWAPA